MNILVPFAVLVFTVPFAYGFTDAALGPLLTRRPGNVAELRASASLIERLKGLAALGWLPRLLGRGDLSSTRFVFLGAFAVASLVMVITFGAIALRFLHTGATDASMCGLAGVSLGTFLGFAANAQTAKHKADATSADPPS